MNTKIYIILFSASGYIKRNLILLLSVFTFFVIGFDLTTEMAESNNEAEFFVSILNNSAVNISVIKGKPELNEKPTSEKIYIPQTSVLKEYDIFSILHIRPPPAL